MSINLFDIALLAIVVVFVVFSAKKGFALSLLNTIAFAFSGILAYKLSGPLSELIFSSFLYDSMQTSFNEILSDISAETTHNGQLLALTEALPEGFVKIWEGFGFNLDNLLNTSMQADYPSNEVMVKSFIDNVASEIVKSVLEIVLFILLFIILSIVLKYIASLLDKVIKITPIAGKANTVLGGVLGVIKGLVLVFVVCFVVCPLVFAIDIPLLKDTITSSVVYEFIIYNNPFNSVV